MRGRGMGMGMGMVIGALIGGGTGRRRRGSSKATNIFVGCIVYAVFSFIVFCASLDSYFINVDDGNPYPWIMPLMIAIAGIVIMVMGVLAIKSIQKENERQLAERKAKIKAFEAKIHSRWKTNN